MEKRVISTELVEEDIKIENNLRPLALEDYIGQEKVKRNLKVYIEAAKARNDSLDHVLFYGPPGLGKTTLAGIIANEMGTHLKVTSGPAIEKPGEMAAILNNLAEGDVLFVDEIHRLNRQVEEVLYPAMEDFTLDMTTGKSQTAKTLRIPLPKFTLIGATTKAGELSSPLRDRFGIIHRLEFYTIEELTSVVKRTAKILDIEISTDGAKAIAMRSRGTPRIASRLIKRVADFAIVKHDGKINENVANESLDLLKIDEFGLDNTDRALLNLIIDKYDGGPVGIETIAAALSEDVRTIEDVCEPYLLQAGLLQRTPRGRKVSPEGYRHLGIKIQSMQTNLFD